MLLLCSFNTIRMIFAQFIILCGLTALFGCVTSGEGPEQEKLAVQRAIVVNYLNRGLANRAINELRPLMVQYPENADLLNLHGLAQLALNNPEDATASLKRAYALRPTLTTGLNLSSSYIEAGKYREAMQLLISLKKDRAELARYSYPERVHHNLGLAFERQNKVALAEKQYRAALKLNPTFYLSLMQLGTLSHKSGKPDSAIAMFRKAQQVCTSCLDPVEGMASALVKKNQSAQARRVLESFLKRKDIDADSRQRGEVLMRKFAANSLEKSAQ